MLRKVLMAGVLALTAATSQAAMVHTDWKAEGDSLASLHEETGKEWLKTTETLGMSIEAVLAETNEGGAYEGWRLPRADEIVTLWEGVFNGSSMLSNPQGTRSNYSLYGTHPQRWVEYIGQSTSDPIRSYGLGYKTNGEIGFFGVSRGSNTTSYWYGYNSYSVSTTNAYFGVLLVSDGGTTLSSQLDPTLNINNPDAPVNQVPVPLASALLLLPLAAFARRRR